jgi:LPS-assembly lipoprotein
MHRLLRLSLPLVLLAASGCGFRLQGETSLPPVLAALRVQTADSQTDFAQALERALQRAGVGIVQGGGGGTVQGGATAPTGEAAVLRIERDELLERVASVSARNVPREYELTYVVRYSLSLGGQTRIDAEEVSVSRDFTFDETAALAKDRERDLLREALARELSGVVLARLASVR